MSDDVKLFVGIMLTLLIIGGIATCADSQGRAEMQSKCHAALQGSTASDSLRIIRLEPKCAP